MTAAEPTTLLALLKTLDVPADRLKRQLKRREVKVNGERVADDRPLAPGDEVEIFLPEAFAPPDIPVLWRDGGVVIADKPAGVDTYRAAERLGARPAHRLDRNTSGLLLLADDDRTLALLESAVKAHAVEKSYYALVLGHWTAAGQETVYMYKDADRALVSVADTPRPGYAPAVTAFRPLGRYEKNGVACTLLDVTLVTGRTHQIRAFFAHRGYPLAGDGKYGDNAANRALGGFQRLVAYRLAFGDIGVPALNGRTVALPGAKERICREFSPVGLTK